MRASRRLESVWPIFVMVAFACSVDVDSRGEGKACSADGRCAEGYVCSPERRCTTGVAMVDASAGTAGEGDGGLTGGAAGTTGEGGTSGSTSGAGGVSHGGTSAAEDAGAIDGGDHADAMEDSSSGDADAGCADPIVYYADADRDGFGRDDMSQRSCTPPSGGWAVRRGDCNDGNPQVFPGQNNYFGTSFSTGAGTSFDYDCSGREDPDASQPGLAPNCTGLSLLGCTGSGFAATGRTGSGVDAICGSTSLVTCVANLVSCGATTSTIQAKRCH